MDSLATVPIPTGLVDVREIGVVISVEVKDGYPALRIYSDALPHGNLIHVFRPEIQYRVHSEHERPDVVRHLLGNAGSSSLDRSLTTALLAKVREAEAAFKLCEGLYPLDATSDSFRAIAERLTKDGLTMSTSDLVETLDDLLLRLNDRGAQLSVLRRSIQQSAQTR